MPRLNSALIRRVNTARVFHALRNHPGSSQRGLCALTLLDASTVSSVVAKLEADRIVTRLDSNRSGQAGRPERMLQINRDGGVLIGAAIETDSIRLIATGMDGERRGALSVKPGETVDIALENLHGGVAELLALLRLDLADVRSRVARSRRVGAVAPAPLVGQAMRTEIGRPNSSMRLRAWTATPTSVARRSSVRERSPSPITCLNLPMAASTRARFV